MLAEHRLYLETELNAHVVNYADDFVICCLPGNAEMATTRMTALMTRLGLEVNETTTRLARIPEDNIKAVLIPNSSMPFADSSAPIICQCGSSISPEALRVVIEFDRIEDRIFRQVERAEPYICRRPDRGLYPV